MSVPKKLDEGLVKKIEARLHKRLKELHVEMGDDIDAFQERLPTDSSEAAPMLDNLEIVQADNDRDADEIEDIRNAIRNIHSGDYGNCTNCSKSIAVERLLAMPHALLCVKCQEIDDKNNPSS